MELGVAKIAGEDLRTVEGVLRLEAEEEKMRARGGRQVEGVSKE
jgi:hypothetical protein